MPTGILNIALGLAMQVGTPGPSEMPNAPVPANAFNQYGHEGSAEQRYPFDSQMNWVHGYFQEIPAYGGHPVFRPYNYKAVLAQSQTAAGWGERPAMPYAQQFWHRYQDQATMLKAAQPMPQQFQYSMAPTMQQRMMPPNQIMQPNQMLYPQQMMQPQPTWVAQPNGLQLPNQQVVWPQATPAAESLAVPANMTAPQLPPALPRYNELNQMNYRRSN